MSYETENPVDHAAREQLRSAGSRFAGIVRPYSPADVERLRGSVHVEHTPLDRVPARCAQWARHSLCHCLLAGTNPQPLDAGDTVVTRLRVGGPRPALADAGTEPEVPEADDALECWGQALEQVLRRWV